MMGLGFVIGAILLIVISKSWRLAAIFIPTLLFIWFIILLNKKHNKDQKKKWEEELKEW